MAVLAVAAVGAFATWSVGLGATAGWIIGSIVGQLLFPPQGQDIVQEGPRIGDRTVSTSTLGLPQGIGYGTFRCAGNIFWALPIEERKTVTEHEVGKGGGGGSTTVITYSYFANFAIGFSEGVADDVLKIWADGKLIFDKTGESGIKNIQKPNFIYRFYPGDEEQLPDPLIEANEGVGSTPAYRGLVYLVFEDFSLADYGNRIPSISALIAFNATENRVGETLDLITTAEGGLAGSSSFIDLTADWPRGVAYSTTTYQTTGTLIRRYNLNTMKEDRQNVLSNDVQYTIKGITPEGDIIVEGDSALHLVNRDILQITSSFGTAGDAIPNTTTDFRSFPDDIIPVRALGKLGYVNYVAVLGPRQAGILKIGLNSLTYLRAGTDYPPTGDLPSFSGCRGIVGEGFGEAWYIVTGTTSAASGGPLLVKLTIAHDATDDSLGAGTGVGVSEDQITDLIDAGYGGWTVSGMVYDPTDNGIIIFLANTVRKAIKYIHGQGIVWESDDISSSIQVSTTINQSRLLGGKLAFFFDTLGSGADGVFVIDTTTGEFTTDTEWDGVLGPLLHQRVSYDSVTHSIFYNVDQSGENTPGRLYLGRATGAGVTLSSIVQDICSRVGYVAEDLDASELTDIVPGFFIANQVEAKQALAPLASGYLFDTVESDYKLKFLKRGRAKTLDVPQNDIVVVGGKTLEAFREFRTQEVELPMQFDIVYVDPARDYQQGYQYDKRIQNPTPAMYSVNPISLVLPIVLEAETVRLLAEKSLFTAWVERSRYEMMLPWSYLKLDPSDVIDIVMNNGNVYHNRLVSLDMGVDYSLKTIGFSDDIVTYSPSNAEADPGTSHEQPAPVEALTKLFVPNLPLLRDTDDLGRTALRAYFFVGGVGQTGWPGAFVHESDDGVAYEVEAQAGDEVTYGYALNALGDTDAPFHTDKTNTVRVHLVTGTSAGLSSITALQMANGQNAAILGDEIIQFQTATLEADGSYTLSNLARGRRGTDDKTGSHRAGDQFILLSSLTGHTHTFSLDALDSTKYYRAVGYGTLFEAAEVLTRTLTGEDLKPYAPVHIEAVVDGSSNIDISWLRRTRINGGWRNGTGDVPLNEDSESYEVDILDGPGGNVLRTLSSSTTSVQYDSADIITDFGSLPSELSVIVYQISAQVDRGKPGSATLEL